MAQRRQHWFCKPAEKSRAGSSPAIGSFCGVAQLVGAGVLYTQGWGFKSLRHNKNGWMY